MRSAGTALRCSVNCPHPRARRGAARPGLPAQPPRHADGCPGRHAHRPPGQLLPALAQPAATGSGSSAAPFSPALPRQGEETPGLPCCSSEPAAPQGRGPSSPCPPAAPGPCSAPGTCSPAPAPPCPSCAPAEAVATQGLPMLWSSPALLQPTANSTASAEETFHLVLQPTSTASPHACPGHHTLFAPSTKSQCFETQRPSPARAGTDRLLGSTGTAGSFLGCSWG